MGMYSNPTTEHNHENFVYDYLTTPTAEDSLHKNTSTRFRQGTRAFFLVDNGAPRGPQLRKVLAEAR